MTVKLKLPPGFYKNGTEYMAAGRYLGGDLIRWFNDTAVPIQGWAPRYDVTVGQNVPPLWGDGIQTEAARSGIVLSNATLGVTAFIGTNKKIYMVTDTNVVSNVTPTAFTPQAKDVSLSTGYGLFRYNYGQYGKRRPGNAGRPPNVFSWGFAEWGFWPVAVARGVGGLRVFIKTDTDPTFVNIVGSPLGSFDVLVTDERFLMTIGSTADFRLIQWSDQEQYGVWTPAVNNQAGSLRLAGSGKLVVGVKLLHQILVIGEDDAFSVRYVGPPYVYGSVRVGDKCGIVGPEAIAVTETFAAWLGNRNFWVFDGTVQRLPCDVLDFFLADINPKQKSKTAAFTLSDFGEVWWLYQSKTSATNEPDSYVIYNYAKKIWYTGRLDRTMGLDSDPMTYALMVESRGHLFDHEVPSASRDGRIPYLETGPLELENGERLLGFSYVYPDERLGGDVLMELSVRDMPKLYTRFARQFALTMPTSTQGIMGRDIRMKLYGAQANPDWSIGDFRVEPLKSVTPRR